MWHSTGAFTLVEHLEYRWTYRYSGVLYEVGRWVSWKSLWSWRTLQNNVLLPWWLCITTAHLTATLWSGMFSWCLTVKRDLVLKSIEILLESGWCSTWCSDDRRIISYTNYLFETFPFSECYWSDRFSIRSIFSRKSRISSLSSGSVTSVQTWKTRTSSRTWVTLNIQTHAHSPTFDLNTSGPIRAAER